MRIAKSKRVSTKAFGGLKYSCWILDLVRKDQKDLFECCLSKRNDIVIIVKNMNTFFPLLDSTSSSSSRVTSLKHPGEYRSPDPEQRFRPAPKLQNKVSEQRFRPAPSPPSNNAQSFPVPVCCGGCRRCFVQRPVPGTRNPRYFDTHRGDGIRRLPQCPIQGIGHAHTVAALIHASVCGYP